MPVKKKKGRAQTKVRVPLLWSACSWFFMVLLGLLIFFLILRKAGVSFPIAEGQSTDPYFFGAVFAVTLPIILGITVARVLRGIVRKQSAKEIATDAAKDIAITGAAVVAETALDAVIGGGADDDRSSSGSSTGGGGFGGGASGGGGATRGY
jgi:uncharacterized membrane protein YgcG